MTRALASAFAERGCDVTILSFDDLPTHLQGKKAQVAFPWFVAHSVSRSKTAFDVLDLSSGDGWRLDQTRFPGSLLVFRSHGLEHVADSRRRAAAQRREVELSWKYGLYHGGWRLREVAIALRNADLALLLNNADRDYAVANLGVSMGRTEVVPNGLPRAFLGQTLPAQPAVTECLRIAMIGSYLPRKGYGFALGPLRRLMERYPTLGVGFFGIGIGNGAAIRSQLGEFSAARVRITEEYAHHDLPALLTGFDIILFPSLSDGFGMAAVEGMSCGLALITTPLCGLAERLTNGYDAIIIPPASEKAIEAAVERLITDPPLLQRLRKAGLAQAQSLSWESVAREQLGLYARHLAKKRTLASES